MNFRKICFILYNTHQNDFKVLVLMQTRGDFVIGFMWTFRRKNIKFLIC